jgi:hypothetical protein
MNRKNNAEYREKYAETEEMTHSIEEIMPRPTWNEYPQKCMYADTPINAHTLCWENDGKRRENDAKYREVDAWTIVLVPSS